MRMGAAAHERKTSTASATPSAIRLGTTLPAPGRNAILPV
jgi:hypothetical protein